MAMGALGHQESLGGFRGHTVSVRLLRALVDVLQTRGIPPTTLLGEDLAPLFGEPVEGRIPLSEYQVLMARALRLAGEPALGLHCGLYAAESSFGLVSPLISHAPSLRSAIELITRFHPLLLEGTHLALSERHGTARMSCEYPRTNAAADRALAELIVAGLYRTLRAFGCMAADIAAVCFEQTSPAHRRAYTAAFSGAERFAQAFTGIEFCAVALDRPHIHGNAELAQLLCVEAERTLKRIGGPTSYTDQVLAIMHRMLRPGHALAMAPVAHELGCSVRSLRRHLSDEQSSFRELEQLVLKASACSMVQRPQHTFQGIAHALGFTSAAAFHRAFKRWTGMTPAEFRACGR